MTTLTIDASDNEKRKPYISYDVHDPCPRCGSIHKIVYGGCSAECLDCKVKRDKNPNKYLDEALRNIEKRGNNSDV